jgi:digeranylgeranylglycerophospholipid reductase
LWIFPKGNNAANIGLGVSGAVGKTRSPLSFLNEFMEKNYPNASVLTSTCGGVPCITTLKKITAPGIMLAGDSAHQVNPLSGGGIASGMVAGKLAGTIAAESVISHKPDHIFSYEEAWRERMGKRHETYNRLKEGIYDLTDEFFNKLTLTVNKIPFEKRTMGKVFTSALLHKPSLLVDVAKVFIV